MKISFAVLCFLTATQSCFAQASPRIEECQKALDKNIDPSLHKEICSAIISQLASDSHVTAVFDDGSFTTSDGIIHEHKLPMRVESALVLNKVRKTYLGMEEMAKPAPQENTFFPLLLSDYRQNIWSPTRDEFCMYHPGEAYLELSNIEAMCPGTIHRIPGQLEISPASTSSSLHNAPTCQKSITFAEAQNGGLSYRLPNVSAKWLTITQRKYSNICFSQFGSQSGQENYLIVLSSSKSDYAGLQPICRRNTARTPVSGSGAVTDNVGSTWYYTYQGTVTTTTTTRTNVPYTDMISSFYAYAYDKDGSLVGTSERSTSSRQGGDPSNALGYNLTSALLSIHLKEHLLENIVSKVSALP